MRSIGGFARALIIGVVVPVVALVGVHAYNAARLDVSELRANAEPLLARARAISEQARPEYEDLALAKLPPNPLNGPFYRLDDQLHEAETIEEPTGVVTADGAIVHAFEFDDGGSPGLVAANGGGALTVDAGLLKVPEGGRDDYLTNAEPMAVPADDIGDVLIRARADREAWIRLAWSKEEDPEELWEHMLDIALLGDGEFHTYVINGREALRRGLQPEDRLTRLLMMPADTDVEIDFIRFLSKRSRFLDADHGVLYETLGAQMRKVLYMLPNQTLEWTIEVPRDSPVLEFGNGVLLDGHPNTFEVRLIAGEQNVALHGQTLERAVEWHDFRYDLAPWAGQSIKLRLVVTGDPENVAFWSNPILHSAPKQPFNVIILLEDALRADYLSAQGYPLDTSPNKIKLMNERGIQFDWAISQATKTRPSVPTLMTSLYPTATGVWHFSDMLSHRYLTLAEIMRSQGFATSSFIQNGNAGPYAGLHQGFSELYDEAIMGQATEEIFGDRVLSWLESHRDRNFFAYLHAIDPHGPYDPPQPFDAWFRETPDDGTPVTREDHFEPASITAPTSEGRKMRYAGEIQHNDALLPVLLDKLDELGLTENTLVIFMSDHGEYMGENGFWEHHPPGLMPVIHVPLMMTYPKRFKDAKRIEEVVQLIDVMPTVLELAAVDRQELLMEGDSLVDLIEGRDAERWRNRVAISEEPEIMEKQRPCPCASALHQDWHLISSTRFWPPRGGSFFPSLQAFAKTRVYEFREDPTEESMLFSFLPDLYVRWAFSDLISDLRDTNMTTWRKLTAGEGVDLQLDPATLERLKGLGYVN